MNTRRLALEYTVVIVTVAMRLSPIERDLLKTGLFALHYRLWPQEDLDDDVENIS